MTLTTCFKCGEIHEEIIIKCKLINIDLQSQIVKICSMKILPACFSI